jgi:NAD(P)-dependent dehydrogenase (short-subunit alcohol dehydrogenase family)
MRNLFDLTGQVAVVTGSSRGIGRAIATRMAEHGATVVVSSRKIDSCLAAADAINSDHPGRAIATAANIASKEDLTALVSSTLDRFGRIDALVCNAASNIYHGAMVDISDEVFRKTFENNVLSNHWLVQAVTPAMTDQGGGSITIVSSIGALRGSSVLGAYNVTKAADAQLVRNLAVELGPRNIRVNAIAPGLIRTNFSRVLWEDEENRAKALKSLPLGRLGEPDDIAGAAVFLASPAGGYVNGELIVIDGGLTVTVGGI